MKARIPSRWSSVANRSKNARPFARSPAAGAGPRRPARNVWRHGPRAGHRGDACRRGPAPPSTVWAAGTTFVTSPAAFASAAGIARPVRMSSIARAVPTARVSRCVPPAPGITPMPDLGLAELGVVAGDDEVAGHGQLAAATEREAADRRDERRGRSAPIRSHGVEVALGMQPLGRLIGELHDVGAGREGAVPGAREHDDRGGRRRSSASSASASSASSPKLSALRASGRSIVTSATPSCPPTGASTRMRRVVGSTSVTRAPRWSSRALVPHSIHEWGTAERVGPRASRVQVGCSTSASPCRAVGSIIGRPRASLQAEAGARWRELLDGTGQRHVQALGKGQRGGPQR